MAQLAVGGALALAAIAVACDAKHTQDDQKHFGPTVTILGTNIDPANPVIPADGVIQVSFDRYLLPATVTRQGFAIVDNLNQQLPADAIRTIYDPIARTVTIAGPNGPGIPWLTQGNLYKLVLPVPASLDDTSDIGGFRAIDGAPLNKNQVREFAFQASAPAGITNIDPPVDFCADVEPIFSAKCSDPSCHGSSVAGDTHTASSLILTSGDGVRVTAIGRVAQGSNTGAKAFTPATPSNNFGVDMAIIEPNDPGSSWLMYKLELVAPPVVDAGPVPVYQCQPPGAPLPAKAKPYQSLAPIRAVVDDEERQILSNYVLGREMPYPAFHVQYETQPLTFVERELVRVWIANGANVRDCGGCPKQDVDAGADGGSDAGTTDAGATGSGG